MLAPRCYSAWSAGGRAPRSRACARRASGRSARSSGPPGRSTRAGGRSAAGARRRAAGGGGARTDAGGGRPVRFVEEAVERRAAKGEEAFVSKVEVVRGGADVYLSTNGLARTLARGPAGAVAGT